MWKLIKWTLAILFGCVMLSAMFDGLRSVRQESNNQQMQGRPSLDSKQAAADAKKSADKVNQSPQAQVQEAPKKLDPAAEEANRKAELVKWKKQGVSIGMSAERVLLSSWGKPEKINRTINQFGEREQWVYDGGSYLYFKDGVLTSIQN